MQSMDGMNYAPKGKPTPVVGPGEFVIAAIGLPRCDLCTYCWDGKE